MRAGSARRRVDFSAPEHQRQYLPLERQHQADSIVDLAEDELCLGEPRPHDLGKRRLEGRVPRSGRRCCSR